VSEQERGTAVRGETYAGQSRHERVAERRARIMEAAVQLFAARDYDDVTVADVCVRAKVSKRYFYEEFSDRLDLLLAVHRELNDWLLDGIANAVPKQPQDLRELLGAMVAAMVGMLVEHPERARVIYINAPRMELRRRGLLRRDAELFGRLTRRALARPRDRMRRERLLLALTAGVTEVVIDWLQRGMTDPPQELVDHLTGLCLSILGGEAK